jgi:hypothetical protein
MRIIPENCPTLTVDTGTIYGMQFEGARMTFYEKDLTIKISDCTWRPADWENLFDKDSDYYQCREAGATAILKALFSLTGEGK